jgi:hypothetical protein
VPGEAAGLASWLARQQGSRDEAALRDLIAPFLAGDVRNEPASDGADSDPADVFVELKVERLLEAVGLPVPGPAA